MILGSIACLCYLGSIPCGMIFMSVTFSADIFLLNGAQGLTWAGRYIGLDNYNQVDQNLV